MALIERRVRRPARRRGNVIAFDRVLRDETRHQSRRKCVRTADIEGDLVLVSQPIEVPPELAAEHSFRASVLGERANGGKSDLTGGDMGGMTVERVVEIERLEPREPGEHRGKLGYEPAPFLCGALDFGGSALEKPQRLIAPRLGGALLFRAAELGHILVAHRGICLRTGTLPSVRQHRGGKAAVFATTEDAVDGDHLDVVLVGGHRHAPHGSALRAPRHEFFHISSSAPLGCGTRYVFRGFPRAPRFGHFATLIVFLFRFYAARSAVTRLVGTQNVFYFAAATAAAISGMSASGSTCHFSVMV